MANLLPLAAIERHETDILIIGSGGGGLFAAIHASDKAPDQKVTLAAKGLIGKSGCTRMVQGGFNVALGADDTIERHFMDTVIGGRWLSNQDMAWRLCCLAVERIHELENEIGCFFDRNPDGTLHQKAFAGQSADRTAHKGDLTGIEIINRLLEQALKRPIETLNEHRAISLIPAPQGEGIAGVLFIDLRTGGFRLVRAKTVLLAAGGGPTMYRFHTPSGDKTMDGQAMALRLGLPLRDMEMVQFHPTGLLAGEHTRMTGTVLEEGLRGAGGHLLDGNGRRFMYDYDARAERATRDVVSRAIYAEMSKDSASPNGGVYLSMSHLGPDNVRMKFPGMVKRCTDSGFDLAAGRVEVVPTAHYQMGGMIVDSECRTEMPGLFIAGEDAGGAHGANRLGGNGVANSTVFGGIAGDIMAQDVQKMGKLRDVDEGLLATEIERACYPFSRPVGDLVQLRAALYNLMWDDVGVIRSQTGLMRGREQLAILKGELAQSGVSGDLRAYNLSWHDWLNMQNLIEISEVITRAALRRENSRGAHYRTDFPEEGSLDLSYFTVARQIGGELQMTSQPVAFTIIEPGKSLLSSEAAS